MRIGFEQRLLLAYHSQMLKKGWNVHFIDRSPGWRSGVKVEPGVDLILVWPWCENGRSGWCVLVDRGYGGGSFSLVGKLVLWNGGDVVLA